MPNRPGYDLQFKSLAEYFENVFSTIKPREAQKIFQDQSPSQLIDLPYSLFASEVIEIVVTYLKSLPKDAIVQFFNFLVTEIVKI